MVGVAVETMSEVLELVQRSRALRVEWAGVGAEVDRLGRDPTEQMDVICHAGFNRIGIPIRYGGLATGHPTFAMEAALEVITNLAAIDGSIGQMCIEQVLSPLVTFASDSGLPDATLVLLAGLLLNEGVRTIG